MITCESESFYVMSNDGKEITMLAQYNIDLTSNIQSKNAGALSFSTSIY